MKKKTIALICAASVLVVAVGGVGIYNLVSSNSSPVEVTSVSSLNSGWWGDMTSTSGMITADVSQVVHLDSDQLVSEVYVKEGDTVKIGDKLLSYDTTILELDYESERLSRRSLVLQKKAAEQELERLKKITPVADDTSSAKEAGLIQNTAVMTATSIEPIPAETESQESPETQTPETTTPEVSQPDTDPSETQTTESEEKEESPLSNIKAYETLDFESEPYQGSGTKEDPYVFFCKDGTTIEASFMNKMLGFNEAGTSKKKGGMRKDGTGSYAVLEIREGDSVQGGFVKSVNINGTVKADEPCEPDVTWTFNSQGVTKNVPEVEEPEDEDDDDDDYFEDDTWGDFGDDIYTATELKDAIREQEDEIKNLTLDIKEAKIKVQQAKRKMEDATVLATINGIVKSVGDPAVGELDDEGFMTVTSNEGLYVRGTISELKLGKVTVGSMMTGMSYESGLSFTAEITEISEFPDTSGYYYYDGNSNASQYPFMAYIQDSKGLSNNESVELSIQEDSTEDSSAIYLYKAYIRSENGQSYVYKADENNRLVKQYIKTGATLYSTTVEVTGGLSLEDRIAFPYGKNVVEGAKTTGADDESSDLGMMY